MQSEYNENKHDPPLARNLPPVSGKIAWSRQLYRRIAAPVETFQKVPELMKMAETKKAIKSYNRLARVLVEYEIVFLQIWGKKIDQAKASLNSTVLVRNPDTQELHVNLGQNVNELLKEIDILTKMGIDIPAQAKSFISKGIGLKEKYDSVCVSLLTWCIILHVVT